MLKLLLTIMLLWWELYSVGYNHLASLMLIQQCFFDKNMLFGRGKSCIEQLSVGEYHDVPFDRGRRGVVRRMKVCLPVDWGLEGTYQVFDRGCRDDEHIHGRKDPNLPCGRGRCGVVESLLLVLDTALALKYMPFDRGRWDRVAKWKGPLTLQRWVRSNINSQWVDKLFKDEATEGKGERARMASFVGAMAHADLVKTTLGPKGMDKILQSTCRGDGVTVTNDGATILKSLHIDNPAAKVLVDISKVQDDEVGDGTTSVVVLAGELLREAEKLVNAKIHPMTIISGFRMAAECARNALLEKVVDNKQDAEKFKTDLMKIAMTTLSSKILSQDKEHFATLAVDAVLRLKGSTNLESIQIIKKPGGSLKDSFLDEGFILDKKIGVGQPKRIENAKILVANTAMDTDKVKIYGARVRVDSMAKVAEIEAAEKQKMREKVEKIVNHGINCFVNRQLIYNFPEELFADAGILAIEHADFDGIERLALVTGGDIASTFDNPESVKLGHCNLIEEIMIGEDKLIHFSGVEMGQACTIVLRGASPHMLDEAERSLHDALCVLSQTVNDSRVLFGGGWPEMVMSKAVDELARKTPGKRSHAIEAFSRALVAIPTIIADNAGLDSAELVAQLRAEHHKEGSNAGIDVISGSVGDMSELGICEAFKVKNAVLLSATEAAEMILRVDEIITCAPRRREDRM